MKNFLFRLTHPSFWIQNMPSDPSVDALINEAIDAGAEVSGGERGGVLTVSLGNLRVWIGNYPYAYGRIEGLPELLPYPLTRVRLRRYVMQQLTRQLRRRQS